MADKVSILAPLRRPDYLKLWLAQGISLVGDKLDAIALAILVYQKTGSMLQMGIVLGISTLPAALFSVIAGMFVDRFDRRMTMIFADLIRAVLVGLVPLIALWSISRFNSIAPVYVIAFCAASVSLFFEPARLALIPEIVPEAELMAANSLDEATNAVAELLGLAIGGAVVALVGWQLAFYLDSATFVVSAIIVLLVRHRETAADLVGTAGESMSEWVAETLGGLKYLSTTPALRDLTLVYAFTALGGASMITLVHLLALWVFKGGSAGLAALDVAITVGMLGGSLLIGRSGPGRAGLKFLLGVLTFGVAMLLLALFPSFVPAIVLLLVAGVGNIVFAVPAVTILQERTGNELRGRVFAARTAIVRIAAFVGLVGSAALAQQLGVTWVIALVGVCLVGAAAIGFTRPALRTA